MADQMQENNANNHFAHTATDAELEAVIGAYHGEPFRILGPHLEERDGKESLVVRAFRPLDDAVALRDLKSGDLIEMTRVNGAGLFEARFPRRKKSFPYRLVLRDVAGGEHEIDDPYAFPLQLSDHDIYLFAEGNLLQSYQMLGAHPSTVGETEGVRFSVWAPNAERVSVIGPFNGWDNRIHPLQRRSDSGIWELFLPGVGVGVHYKYAVKSRMLGYEADKTDPYGFYAEMRPSTDSRVWSLDNYAWHDEEWLGARRERQALDQPINIYEVHLGSWRRIPESDDFLSYPELAHQLVDYCRKMNYTHIELMPITEHPFDGSWGYQATGYFAPTSRFGTPDEFKYFVDYCHQHGIGVILDWVPAHFPKDAHGLAFFDGSHLYEHADPRQGEHRDWGTKIFNFGRNEVCNFLLSSALFWVKEYHMDGLRVDAVASMLYLDYSREQDEWIPNQYGGRENLEAINFIRRFNDILHEEAPGVLTIAEESTAWPMVTKPTYTGGLGFDLKWNMGWMHDTLSYMEKDPIYRRYHQNEITFSLIYAFSENYVLPFSHDEVVHLKRSMLDKMPGDLWQKQANLRLLYTYMTAHPGKKLLFMGGEFGQWTEWSEAKSLDWHLLEFGEHRQLQQFVAELNGHYLAEPALYQVDDEWEGFRWIDISDADQSIVSFARFGADPEETVVVVCNFTPIPRLDYRVGLPHPGTYTELLNSDWPQYGGSGINNQGYVSTQEQPWQNCDQSAPINLPPLGAVMLKRVNS